MAETVKIWLQGWSWFRFLRLGIGIYVVLDTAFRGEWMIFPIGLMLIVQAVFNAGCVSGNCGIPANQEISTSEADENQEIEVIDAQEVEIASAQEFAH